MSRTYYPTPMMKYAPMQKAGGAGVQSGGGLGSNLLPDSENATSLPSDTNLTTGWSKLGSADSTLLSLSAYPESSYQLILSKTGGAPGTGIQYDLNSYCTNGTTYQLDLLYNTANTYAWGIWLAPGAGTLNEVFTHDNTTDTGLQTLPSYQFTYDSNHRYLNILENNGTNSINIYLDNVQIREVL